MQGKVETGYEKKFDFSANACDPKLTYLLASVPRSGSTFVSHLLWQSGCLGAPLEYLNFEPAGPAGYASGTPEEQTKVWEHALSHRTSPNGVFGLKAFPLQLEVLGEENPRLLRQVMRTLFARGRRSPVIQLRRRDRTAHGISYARAMLSGVWRSEQETGGRPEPAYSSTALNRALALIDEQESAWEAMYRALAIEPLVLYFEDVLRDPESTIRSVAEHLGVELTAGVQVHVPAVRRQSQLGAQAWREANARQEGN